MQRTHFLTQTLFCIFILISSQGLFAQIRSLETEFFGSFEHVPRDPAAIDGSGGAPTGPTGPTDVLPVPGTYRNIDGTSNNLSFPEWGATDIVFKREIAAAYDLPDRLNSLAGSNRKSAREISNVLNRQGASLSNSNNLSSFVFTWGQFIDHDIDLSGESGSEPAPISLPSNEPTFTVPIRFTRSEVFPSTGISTPREQVNLITSWIDASNVYGSERQRANWLRTYSFGKLKTSAGNLLPYNTTNGERNGAIDPFAPSMASAPEAAAIQFVAGDVRANEQPGLTTLHTLFVREHNRYCEELRASGLTNDEEMYQLARKWVGGLLQHVTFTEFLPALGINLDGYTGYNNTIQPDIMNLFATAAYRIGHTMVTEELLVLDEQCNAINANTTLAGNFFNNSLIQNYGIESIFRGLSAQTQEEIDLKVVDGLRDFLFDIPGAPAAGLDLASLNIQRGRDHGLPDYNTVRQRFLGQRATNFNQISSDPDIQYRLQLAYDGDINNIDPWIGLLAEDHAPNASVGPTMQAIMKEQFQRLRNGDYYYFENDPFIPAAIRQQIRSTTLSTILTRNTTMDASGNIFQTKNCMGSGGGSACDQVTFTANNGSLSINNLSAAFKNIKIYRINISGGYDYPAVYECIGNCSSTTNVANIQPGNYAAFLSLYDNNWSPICGENLYNITVDSGGNTTGGNNNGNTTGGNNNGNTTGGNNNGNTTGGNNNGNTTGGNNNGNTTGGNNNGGNGSPCDQISFSGSSGTLLINNVIAVFQNIKVFQINQYGGYNSPAIYECIGSCQTNTSISSLSDGQYDVLVTLFDNNWSPICGENIYSINLAGGYASSRSDVLELAAYAKKQQVQLSWVYNNTYKGDHFLIERSADGKEFMPIAKHPIEEKNFDLETFNGLDKKPLEGANYYRVQVVDNAGFSKYTATQKVAFHTLSSFSLFPNPATRETFINLSKHTTKEIQISIANQLGHIVYEKSLPSVEDQFAKIDTQEFSNGVYFVTIKTKGQAPVSKKLVVKHLY